MPATRGPRVTVCYSREELTQVRDAARTLRMSLSGFIRSVSLAEKPRSGPRRTNREAVYQLARIGNNLNQIARWANTHRRLRSERELEEALEKVTTAIEELS